ncbi:MAG TPA: nucleoside deaminase [Longimicrobiales bacterium]|nr:nucleoside deaminase [Longimicrobiales bacterium]
MRMPAVHVELPDWVEAHVDWDAVYATDEARVALAIELSRENVRRGLGGPFGAAVFEQDSGRLVSVGVNLVVPLANSMLHAEVVAFMLAQRRLGTYTLAAPGLPAHVLASSCEPCAMCLGASLWSGVCRIAAGALREDAMRMHFEEGPVFPESYTYLEARGISIVRGVLRDEASAVLETYVRGGGPLYNR